MTPEQRNQVELVKRRINGLRLGGMREELIVVELRREGWPEGAIEIAMEAGNGGKA